MPESVSEEYHNPAILYPWHQSLWQQLYGSVEKRDNFPHALLFSGLSGTGKKALAYYLAQSLMCHAPVQDAQAGALHPCKQCRSCQLLMTGNHPDLFYLTTPEDKKIIPVKRVRELIQWTVLSSQLLYKKVVIIEPADAMNQSSANSLLKTLEEPVANTVLILVTSKKQSLLPTIRSRCQAIDITRPAADSAQQWLAEQGVEQAALMLALASGSPLNALKMARSDAQAVRKVVLDGMLDIALGKEDPVTLAEQWFKLTKAKKSKTKSRKSTKDSLNATEYELIYWLDSVLTDMARLTHLEAQADASQMINNLDYYQNLQPLSNRLYLKSLMQASDSVNKAYYEIQGSINFNLLLEKLLIDWKNCFK